MTGSTKPKITSTVAREDDGTIQINLTIPYAEIKKERGKAFEEYGKSIVVPGFRKGKAPIEKIAERIPQNELLEATLNKILPEATNDAIKKHNLKIAIYPKFELVKAKDNEDWQIRALTCELPQVELGKYKEALKGESRKSTIWTPGKSEDEKQKKSPQITRQEKEQGAINLLLKNIQVKIPKILINQQVDARLANLLERLEKLGLTLESYLSSIGKTADQLRNEYENSSKDNISLELILNKIADEEKLTVSEADIEKAVEATESDPKAKEQFKKPEQRQYVEGALRRRNALDYIVSLV